MKNLMFKLSLAAPLVAASMMLVPSASLGQAVGHLDHNIRLVQGGRTDIAFASTFFSILTNQGLALTTSDGAEIRGERVFLPTTASGMVDVNSARVQVLHSGAIVISGTGKNSVTMTGFILDSTTSAPVISAIVSMNGTLMGRVAFLDLTVPSTLTLPLATTDELLQIDANTLTLDSAMASFLNSVYGGGSFVAGSNMGVANLNYFLL